MVRTYKKKVPRLVSAGDFETDPFVAHRTPKPFAAGLMIEHEPGNPASRTYIKFWGNDCVEQLLAHLASIQTPLLIYFHNGGKFDFFFFLKYLENPLKVIHGRIVKARIGIHEFRDSWAIIPMALKGYKKTEIDYKKLEAKVRSKHKSEILAYLRDDCTYLLDLVSAFVLRFGVRLTIAGTGMRELTALHPQYKQKRVHDDKFRPFYMGGRVECFESGILKPTRGQKWKVYDVNGMYSYVMRECRHPIGGNYVIPANKTIGKDGWIVGFPNCMYFAVVRGRNRGALPGRIEDGNGGLSFTIPHGIFHTTSHELRLALTLGLFDIEEILELHVPRQTQSFGEFVDKFVAEKITGKLQRSDPNVASILETFAKFMLNAPYGRFGINPWEFKAFYIQVVGDLKPENEDGKLPWTIHQSNSDFTMWVRTENDIHDDESEPTGFEDVAIASSITSAARAVLLLAVVQAKRPIYCDTDSIICEGIRNVQISDTALGAWKFEKDGDECAIGGKKLYALFKDGVEVKSASKGVKFDGNQIRQVANGEEVIWQSDAPNFSLLGSVRYIHRMVRSTNVKR